MTIHVPIVASHAVARPSAAIPAGSRARTLLLVATGVAASAAVARGYTAGPATVEADLGRVLRFMAAMKLAFAAAAFAASWWRLGRPAAAWRTLAYVGGPALAASGAILMLSLADLGLAAVTLHAGLLAGLAAALTDGDFIQLKRRSPLS
jgi:hypothetical protein